MRISDFRPDDAEDELDVVMRFMGDQRNLDRLGELRVPASDGSYVPLSVFARLQPRQKGGDIERKDGDRYMYINADVAGGRLPVPLYTTEAVGAFDTGGGRERFGAGAGSYSVFGCVHV